MGGRVVDGAVARFFCMLGGLELVATLLLWSAGSHRPDASPTHILFALVGLGMLVGGVLLYGVYEWDDRRVVRRGAWSWQLRWSDIATCAMMPAVAAVPVVLTDRCGRRRSLVLYPTPAMDALYEAVWQRASEARAAEELLVSRGESVSGGPGRDGWRRVALMVLAGVALVTLGLTGLIPPWQVGQTQAEVVVVLVGLGLVHLGALAAGPIAAHRHLPRLGPEGVCLPASADSVYLRWHEVQRVCLRHLAGGVGEHLILSGAGRSVRITQDAGSWLAVLTLVRRLAQRAEWRDETTAPRHPRWEALLREILGPLDRSSATVRPDLLSVMEGSIVVTKRQKPLLIVAVIATLAVGPLQERLREVTLDGAEARKATATVVPSQAPWMPMVLFTYAVGGDQFRGETWRIPGRDGNSGAGAKVAIGYRAADPKRSWLWTAEPPARVARARSYLAAALVLTLVSVLLSVAAGIGDRRRSALL